MKQVSAIDQVIAIHDPEHTALLAGMADRKRSRQEVPLPITLVQLNKTAAILEVLREAGEPLSSADCTNRIATKQGVAPMIQLHDVIHHTRPDGSHFPLEECAIDRALPEELQMQDEEVFAHRNGSFYPVAFTASPIQDEGSRPIGTIIEVRDIRAEKQAQEHQRVLINELNHRVKNTLATVQSIAAQMLRNAPSTQEAKEALEGRLFALSRTHDVLTRESWEGADLYDIAAQAVEPYSTQGEDRLHLNGPHVRLPPRMALALATAFQELATNAVKYGALSVPGGEIRITWAVDPLGSDKDLHLRWEERGGPPVEPPARRGFGTRLIERSLAQDLGGDVRIEFAPNGVVCTVAAPLESS